MKTKLIDTHLHLIYPEHFGYSWTKGIDVLEGRSFGYQDYLAASGGEVESAIFMEVAVDEGDYAREALEISSIVAKEDGRLAGVIASARPEREDFEAWLLQCVKAGFCGVRRVLHVEPDSLSQTDVFKRNLCALGEAGLSFDLILSQAQLGLAPELLRSASKTQFILNHLGVPDIAGGDYEGWAQSMSALAQYPNLAVKVSGITAYCNAEQRNFAGLRPYLDHALNVFGSERLVWGSDYPVVLMGDGLESWLDITQQWLQTLPPASAQAIARDNARAIYRL
ncbi:MAG: amidohydrolase family protein [Gammaproteobacteria bacterium]|nr:amidohydrolase family protein [Gammaproteobacteria bacterium]